MTRIRVWSDEFDAKLKIISQPKNSMVRKSYMPVADFNISTFFCESHLPSSLFKRLIN